MSKRFREPSALEKTFMVRHAWESREVNGMDDDQLKQERKWLAERFGCSEESAQSICAHARIRFDAVVPGELTVTNAEFARRWVSLASDRQEREAYQREIAEQLKVDMRVIREITDGVRLETEELITAEDAPKTTARARALTKSEEQFVFSFLKLAKNESEKQRAKRDLAQYLKVDPAVIAETIGEGQARAPQTRKRVAVHTFDHAVELQKGGEHVDYDTENKEAWRQAWKKFIDEHTDPRERARMRVLCLPAKQCLEIPVYTELGFKAANIVAVEGGDRIAQAQFELSMKDPANIARWGGQPDYRLARLEDIIGKEKEPFDVISLDFLGQMCARNLRICSSIPVSDNALFLMTTWTRRWAEKEQQEFATLLRSADEARAEDRELRRAFLERHPNARVTADDREPDAQNASMGLVNLGVDRDERWAFRKRMKRIPLLPEAKMFHTTHAMEREDVNLSVALEPLLQTLGTALIDARCVDHASLDDLRAVSRAAEMASHVIFRKPIVRDVEHWQYQSMVSSAKNHEFHTDMGAVERPSDLYARCELAADFLLRCCEATLKNIAKQSEAQRAETLRNFSFDVAAKGSQADPTGSITCRDGNKIVATIAIAEFMAAARAFSEYMNERPLHSVHEQCAVPRKTIS